MNLLGEIDPWDPNFSVQEASTSNEKPFPFRPEFRERISRSSSPPNCQRGGWWGVMDLFPHPGCPLAPIASISAPSSPRKCRPHTKFCMGSWRCSSLHGPYKNRFGGRHFTAPFGGGIPARWIGWGKGGLQGA